MVYDTDQNYERNRNQSWWKQRTNMERLGMLLLAIAFLVILGLIIAIILLSTNKEHLSEDEVEGICLKPACVQAANEILQYIDETIDPCEDFYQFTCGRFLKETTIPDDKAEVTSFSIVNDVLQKQLKEILEESSSSKEAKPFVLLKKLYNICMNATAVEVDNLATLKNLLEDLGGFPVLEAESWDDEEFDWKEYLYKFRKNGLTFEQFFSFDVTPDPKNSSRRVVYFDQVTLSISRDNLLEGPEDGVVKTYHDYMVDLAVLFGANRTFAESEVDDMMAFLTKLANITAPEEERRNSTALYHPMTIRKLQRNHSSIPWKDLINGLVGLSIKSIDIDDAVVIISNPKYISDLEFLLKKGQKKRAQANYMIFEILRTLQPYLAEEVRNREQQFQAEIYGISAMEPRWSECVTIATESLSLAAGALYARKHFNKEAKRSAIKMVSDIRSELLKLLRQIKWMDEETKEKAIEKASAMAIHIGYSDELLDDKKLVQYYSGLTFASDNYLQLSLQISNFTTNKEFGELWKPVNKTEWSTRIPPATVNAGYAFMENSIQIPAAILQGVFFDQNRPVYMNYAAIGSIIGHEITHGFDDEGKQFDKEGNLVNWWAEQTDKAFMEKAKCIVDQYTGYTVPEVNISLNGVITQGENIADNGGIKEAYLAYKTYVEREGVQPVLPGLNYTTKQIFWISLANMWCTKERDKSAETSVLTDNHSPGRFRVIGPFSNSVYFAKDFKCGANSKMNSKRKCQVW